MQGFGGDGGPATSAQLNGPSGVAVDSAGNLYIADSYNDRVREVSNGVITTVAGNGVLAPSNGIPGGRGYGGFSGDGGPATSAQLSTLTSVSVDSAGNLYISDYDNYRVRKVSNPSNPSGGVITTVAGSGPGGGFGGFGGDGGPATSAAVERFPGAPRSIPPVTFTSPTPATTASARWQRTESSQLLRAVEVPMAASAVTTVRPPAPI